MRVRSIITPLWIHIRIFHSAIYSAYFPNCRSANVGTVLAVRSISSLQFSPQCPALCDPMDWNPPGSSLSMGFFRQEYWTELHFSPPGNLPDPGIKPPSCLLCLLHWEADSLPLVPPGKPFLPLINCPIDYLSFSYYFCALFSPLIFFPHHSSLCIKVMFLMLLYVDLMVIVKQWVYISFCLVV